MATLSIQNSSGQTTSITPSATGTGALTLPAATDTLVGQNTTDTLTNKTLTSPTINNPTINTPTINNPTISGLSVTNINGGQIAGMRNRIINGDMKIDQRNAGLSQSITAVTSGSGSITYTVDRFYAYCTTTSSATVTGQRVPGNTTLTYTSVGGYGGSGTSSIAFTSVPSTVIAGQIITGTGIPTNTYITSVNYGTNTTVGLSTALTAQAAGTYTVYANNQLVISGTGATAGSSTITFTSIPPNILAGMYIAGTGIPANTKIGSINYGTNTITLANSVTLTAQASGTYSIYGAGPYFYQFTGATGTTGIYFGQRIESANCADLAGQVATLSFDMANSALSSVNISVYYATSPDLFGTTPLPTGRTTVNQINLGQYAAQTISSTISRYSIPIGSTTPILITGASGNGTTATLTFASQLTAPFSVGTSITISGINPTGYNGTYTVTACTATSVSFANTTTSAYVSGGTITNSSNTIPGNATNGIEIVFSVGAQTSGTTWTIGNVQLELGSTATTFERRPLGQELALCQRYFETSYDFNVKPGTVATAATALFNGSWGGVAINTGDFYNGNLIFKNQKKYVPTMTVYSLIGTLNSYSVVAGTDSGGSSFRTTGMSSAYINGTGLTASLIYYLHWVASAEL